MPNLASGIYFAFSLALTPIYSVYFFTHQQCLHIGIACLEHILGSILISERYSSRELEIIAVEDFLQS